MSSDGFRIWGPAVPVVYILAVYNLGVYSFGAYSLRESLGVYSLERPILDLGTHSLGATHSLDYVYSLGCRGGSRYFDGVPYFLKRSKIRKNDLPKIPRFHAHPNLFKHIQYFQKYFDLVGFT